MNDGGYDFAGRHVSGGQGAPPPIEKSAEGIPDSDLNTERAVSASRETLPPGSDLQSPHLPGTYVSSGQVIRSTENPVVTEEPPVVAAPDQEPFPRSAGPVDPEPAEKPTFEGDPKAPIAEVLAPSGTEQQEDAKEEKERKAEQRRAAHPAHKTAHGDGK